jgi:hypothetical protein
MGTLDWLEGCAEGALKYGGGVALLGGGASGVAAGAAAATTGAALGATAGVGVSAAVVGGIYGCLVESGSGAIILSKMERAADSLGGFFARQGRRIERWSDGVVDDIVDFFGGDTKPKKRRTPPPSLDVALTMIKDHLSKLDTEIGVIEGGEAIQFQMQFSGGWRDVGAAWPLHHSNRVALYGDAAVGWDADALYRALAVLYTRTPRRWPPESRIITAIKRLGDYLVESPDVPLERYPVLDQGTASSTAELYGEQRDDAHERDQKTTPAGLWVGLGLGFGALVKAISDAAPKRKTNKEAA